MFTSVIGPASAVRRPALVALAVLTLIVALLGSSSPAHAQALGLPASVTFQSLATGHALDSNFEGSVYGSAPNTGFYQKWRVQASDNDTVTLRNSRTALCLDSNTEGHVYTLSCNNGSFQKWSVYETEFGTKALQNLATGLFLDGKAAGAIYTHSFNNGSYQKWMPSAG